MVSQTLDFKLAVPFYISRYLLSRYFAVSLSRYPAVSLSRCLAISLSRYLAISLSRYLYIRTSLSTSLCMCTSLCTSLYPYLSVPLLFALFILLEDRPAPPASPLRSLRPTPTHVRWAFFLHTHTLSFTDSYNSFIL